MTPHEAFAAIALVAVACDGVLDKDESAALRTQLAGRTPYRDLSDRLMVELFDHLLACLRARGWEDLLREAIHALSSVQQETALAMAAFLVYANHVVDPVQEQFLHTMTGQVSLSQERSSQILDVIALLNRDSLAI